VTAQVDFFEIITGSASPVKIIGLQLAQTTELGDAAEEFMGIAIKTGQTTTGTGGTQAATPAKTDIRDGTPGFTYDSLNTAKASGGTIVTCLQDAFNVRAGYQLWLPPEAQIRIAVSSRATVELTTTPADSITFVGTLWCSEV
jgi:hypothetical protein